MRHFKCCDMGYDCDWECYDDNEDSLLKKIKEHGSLKHGIKEITKEMLQKIKDVISYDDPYPDNPPDVFRYYDRPA